MQEQEATSEVRNTSTIQEDIRLVTEESKILLEKLKTEKLTTKQRQEYADSIAIMDEASHKLAIELRDQSLLERVNEADKVGTEAEAVLGGIATRGQEVRVPDPITGQPITIRELKEHNEAVSAGAIDASR